MTPTTWFAIAASFSAIASFAAAWAVYESKQTAHRFHDLHRWSLHGANVQATCAWAQDQESFKLTVRNEGPGSAYEVYAEVGAARENFIDPLPEIDPSNQWRFDLAPGQHRVLNGQWQQLSEK